MKLAFYRFNLVEQVHIFGLSNIHTYGYNISLIRLVSLIFNYAKPRIKFQNVYSIYEQGTDIFRKHITEKHPCWRQAPTPPPPPQGEFLDPPLKYILGLNEDSFCQMETSVVVSQLTDAVTRRVLQFLENGG